MCVYIHTHIYIHISIYVCVNTQTYMFIYIYPYLPWVRVYVMDPGINGERGLLKKKVNTLLTITM